MTPFFKSIPEKSAVGYFTSPIGKLTVVASDQGIHAILWPRELEEPSAADRISGLARDENHPLIERALRQLEEYFSGTRTAFDLPLSLCGTRFQQSAWNVLREIPYGRTLSYEEQAIRIGGKEKVRAVGRANGLNPVPIIIPCHRVIGKNGSLTGFGGGLETKAFLLRLESRHAHHPG